MAIDPNRAAFVSAPYRYEEIKDAAIEAKFKNSRQIVVETRLSKDDALAYLAKIVAANDSSVDVYEVKIEGIIELEDIDVNLPQYTITSFVYGITATKIFKLAGFTTDYNSNTTEILLRSM
ncbi:hypothetical protein GRI62_11900 [Erythrobacter arachoides]|uniref:Uncharacterized protein n=1 Tax=Aurantiacibacter arachoides TaxID=1850444 RepID=A0A845A9P6_9SPHN|nr:hypothetical protein [Aurantiacibacter arachoides]MXO94299.1 hypothetical protein [Aurantiacibacter arachoides]GGD64549.1 hypothetical protein GCM10011411_26090 [Aurantiacibacter arachoides]